MIPNDDNMLLSYLNMKLRDEYSSLESFCDDTEADYTALLARLARLGLTYNEAQNKVEWM